MPEAVLFSAVHFAEDENYVQINFQIPLALSSSFV